MQDVLASLPPAWQSELDSPGAPESDGQAGGAGVPASLPPPHNDACVMLAPMGMLVTAREMDCQFIWNAHAAFGRQSGLADSLVDALRNKNALTGLSPQESAVVDYGREFFRTQRVSQETFDKALSQFGVRGLVELTNLMGFYANLAFNANAFGMDLPEERTEKVLPI